jgi:hypothetical protein
MPAAQPSKSAAKRTDLGMLADIDIYKFAYKICAAWRQPARPAPRPKHTVPVANIPDTEVPKKRRSGA